MPEELEEPMKSMKWLRFLRFCFGLALFKFGIDKLNGDFWMWIELKLNSVVEY